MAFWGIEVKSGKPFTHRFDNQRGRLHISQATLGFGSSTQKSVVQCIVGDKSPILLCVLLPDKNESCPLDLEFEEEDKVIFSVLGPRSVHLTGYYIAISSCGHEHDDDSESYGEDIAETDTDESNDFISEDEEYDEDFIDDGDLEMFPPSSLRKSAVVIEEILDDEKPAKGNGSRKRLKKKYQISDSDGDDQKQIVVKDNTGSKVLESEDEDGFPISAITNNKATAKSNEEGKSEKKKAKESKEVEDGSDYGTGTKRKIDTVIQDSEAEKSKVSEQPKDFSVPSTEIGHENDAKPKKKRKERSKRKNCGVGDDGQGDVQEPREANPEVAKTYKMNQDPVDDEPKEKQPEDKTIGNADEDTSEKKKKRKKKKKKSKAQESDENANKDADGKKELTVDTEDKKKKVKSSQVRTFGNGLVIEEVKMGKPDAELAAPGYKVAVNYIGKLKSNGKIFDSNVSRPPFAFRLGVGQVIPGWDFGVNGMRVGDKRRLTIPPSMGYGAKGAPPKIPQNAWLVFDVELVSVHTPR